MSATDEPEPDAALVRGTADVFEDRHPRSADVLAVFEASDSSLRLDRTTKQRKYALAEIGQYLIVNLAEGWLELYTMPLSAEGRYAHRADYLPDQALLLKLDAGEVLEIPVADLFPR